MPPSAKRSQRGLRDLCKVMDSATAIEIDMEDSSPSRPVKRRKKVSSPDRFGSGGPTVPPLTQPLDAESLPTAGDDQLVAQVTPQLKCQPVQACKDHANAIHEANGDGVKAYAKVAAQDWTFYITKLNVNIGRAPEILHASGDDDGSQDHIHIDLGPSKMVSREHASICFDSKEEKWVLQIKGRNGAKVNGQPLKSRTSHSLTSGEVIEVGNVEMMFVLPSEISPLHVHPIFLQRCGLSSETPRVAPARRHPLIAPVPSDRVRPGTPPSTQRCSVGSSTRSPAAASTPAIMIGTNGLDLSHDDNLHIKPQYSYAQMITQAILNAPDGKLNLNGIYTFIMSSYSYYRHQQAAGWQNSIRHNLSLNRSFDKIARSTDEPGKGMKWQIVPEARDEMVRNAYKIGRGGHRGSSAPSSPSQLNYITQGPKEMAARDSPSSRKQEESPLASPRLRPSFYMVHSTPDRTSTRKSGRSAALTADGSPLPRQRKPTTTDSTFSTFQPQSPTLTSSYLQEDGASFVTPAPPRVHPKLAPPSTAQRPSQHMPTSSPAPFWKYADVGSTPLKAPAQYELSPSKIAVGIPPQSSSPPRASKSPPSSPSRPQRSGPQQHISPLDEIEEEQGFDLTKGFQSIGAYHAPVGRGVSVASALRGGT